MPIGFRYGISGRLDRVSSCFVDALVYSVTPLHSLYRIKTDLKIVLGE